MSLVLQGVLLIIMTVAYDTFLATGRISKNKVTMGISIMADVIAVVAIGYGLWNHV
jgi:hypothetical protein